MDEKVEDEAGDSLFSRKSPAQAKWDEERGAEIGYVAEWLRKRPAKGLYVYELVYRVDLLQKDDNMLLVKGILDGEAVVAFVFAQGLLTGLSNLAGLFRSGKLKWRQDQFPSKKVKKVLEPIAEDE